MVKKFSILFFINISLLLSMEKIEIVTSDGIKNTIPQKHLLLSKVFCDIQETFPNNDNSIPLPITSEMLPLLKDCLKNSYILKKNQFSNTSKKSLEIQLSSLINLYTILLFANKFDTPYLLKYCMKLWAKAKYDPEKHPLPDEINKGIASYMKQSRQLIDNTAKWIAQEKILLPKKNLITLSSIWSTAIDKKGLFIASGHDNGTILIYNLNTDEFQCIKSGHSSCIGLQFNENNEIWSCGQDGTIKIWDLASKKNIRTITSDLCYGFVFRYIPQYNTLIADRQDNKICFWNLAKNNESGSFDAHVSSITALESTSDGSLFCIGF